MGFNADGADVIGFYPFRWFWRERLDQDPVAWRDLGLFKIMAIGPRSDDYDHIPVQRICGFNLSLPSQIWRLVINHTPSAL